MVEHSFYQGLNLAQAMYLHALSTFIFSVSARLALATVVTGPWLLRGWFPVNRFSDNYRKAGVGGKGALIRALYRIKKYQYLLYKHFLLHGLNASVAVTLSAAGGQAPLAASGVGFRLYWLCLNTAYVMEFFLQTLVKRGYLPQPALLWLQQVLMCVSTFAAFAPLRHVLLWPALLSLGLNFARRHREMSNTLCVLAAALLCARAPSEPDARGLGTGLATIRLAVFLPDLS